MSTAFYTKLTAAGVNAMTRAVMNNEPISITEMAVGDGGGNNINPDGMQGLVNEVYRAPLNRLVIADLDRNVIRAEMLMMPGLADGGCVKRRYLMTEDLSGRSKFTSIL